VGFDEMARSAVEAVAGRLAQRGTDAAGRLTDAALDGVYRLIAQRLSGSATGRRVLDLLVRNPADRQNREHAAEMLTDEASGDPRFADSLGRAAAHAGVFIQGPGASYRDSRGDFRDISITGARNVKFKKFHIGSIRFGTGGLVTGILALVTLGGGGTAAVVAATGDSTELSAAVGSWTQQPGGTSLPGWTVGPISLTVTADGDFTFSMRATMDVPADVPQSPGFGDINLDCSGTITPDGDHFTLRTTSGPCGTFEAKPGPSDVLDVFIDNGSTDGSLALTKVQ
jgi:hypothetical protein